MIHFFLSVLSYICFQVCFSSLSYITTLILRFLSSVLHIQFEIKIRLRVKQKSKMKFIFMLLIFVVAVKVNCDDKSDRTVILNSENFADRIKLKKFFVLFTSPS